ncbi:hypothetical protein NDU88_005652 [Pleurodeles waltl]|uniref:Uncharacterized protein n=1 Tax=Pleurodeles waltl TaxID=8319 RepID=A0AAV7SMA3_PLEWA|nr:hypothetical protein NDU88_005652 [Pleurodeles waltl]
MHDVCGSSLGNSRDGQRTNVFQRRHEAVHFPGYGEDSSDQTVASRTLREIAGVRPRAWLEVPRTGVEKGRLKRRHSLVLLTSLPLKKSGRVDGF